MSHHGGCAYPGLEVAYGEYESSTKGGTAAYKAIENGKGSTALTDKVHLQPSSLKVLHQRT